MLETAPREAPQSQVIAQLDSISPNQEGQQTIGQAALDLLHELNASSLSNQASSSQIRVGVGNEAAADPNNPTLQDYSARAMQALVGLLNPSGSTGGLEGISLRWQQNSQNTYSWGTTSSGRTLEVSSGGLTLELSTSQNFNALNYAEGLQQKLSQLIGLANTVERRDAVVQIATLLEGVLTQVRDNPNAAAGQRELPQPIKDALSVILNDIQAIRQNPQLFMPVASPSASPLSRENLPNEAVDRMAYLEQARDSMG